MDTPIFVIRVRTAAAAAVAFGVKGVESVVAVLPVVAPSAVEVDVEVDVAEVSSCSVAVLL